MSPGVDRRGLVRCLIDPYRVKQLGCAEKKAQLEPPSEVGTKSKILTGRRRRSSQVETSTVPTHTVPNLTSYCRDSPLLLVHPVLQHLLDFLPRRLVLFFFLLRVIEREPGHPILC
jgi:hypothetical protein